MAPIPVSELRFEQRGESFSYRPRLKITERFFSLQGEGLHAGLPCSFVRLTGCALRCVYCDTEYAFHGGHWQSFDDLEAWLHDQPTKLVQITGGEPLHQRAVWPWVDHLIELGFKPLIETSGAVSIAGLHPLAHIVMDLKTPDSGECDRNLWSNLEQLKATDEIKFVICSRSDLQWAIDTIRCHELDTRFKVLISPEWGVVDKTQLAEDLLASGCQARFQLQLHKMIWQDARGK